MCVHRRRPDSAAAAPRQIAGARLVTAASRSSTNVGPQTIDRSRYARKAAEPGPVARARREASMSSRVRRRTPRIASRSVLSGSCGALSAIARYSLHPGSPGSSARARSNQSSKRKPEFFRTERQQDGRLESGFIRAGCRGCCKRLFEAPVTASLYQPLDVHRWCRRRRRGAGGRWRARGARRRQGAGDRHMRNSQTSIGHGPRHDQLASSSAR